MSAGGSVTGRIALRREGKWWVAYYANRATLVGALELGRIRMNLVEGDAPEAGRNKATFMTMMQTIVGDMIERVTGIRPDWTTQQAPEHERSGNA